MRSLLLLWQDVQSVSHSSTGAVPAPWPDKLSFINSFLQEKQKPINYNSDFIPLNSSELQGKSLKTLL